MREALLLARDNQEIAKMLALKIYNACCAEPLRAESFMRGLFLARQLLDTSLDEILQDTAAGLARDEEIKGVVATALSVTVQEPIQSARAENILE